MKRRLMFYSGILFLVLAAFCGFQPTVVAAQPIETEIDIHPQTLNLKAKGKVITCIVEAPPGYAIEDIDPESVLITDIGGVAADIAATRWAFEDDDTLMLKYPRSEVVDVIVENQLKSPVAIRINGSLANYEEGFTGVDTVKIKGKGPKK